MAPGKDAAPLNDNPPVAGVAPSPESLRCSVCYKLLVGDPVCVGLRCPLCETGILRLARVTVETLRDHETEVAI